MNIVDKDLYDSVKIKADKIYSKPSAYKSGYIVKEYKRQGGRYKGKFPTNKGLDNWFKASWMDVAGASHSKNSYPVYRPTKRVSKETPLIVSEIDPVNLQQQITLKQKIRGSKNLPPFLPK